MYALHFLDGLLQQEVRKITFLDAADNWQRISGLYVLAWVDAGLPAGTVGRQDEGGEKEENCYDARDLNIFITYIPLIQTIYMLHSKWRAGENPI